MKILLVSHSADIGGAELCFVEMLKALSDSNKYKLYTVFPSDGKLVDLCRPYCENTFKCYLPWWVDDKVFTLREKFNRFVNILASTKKAYKIIGEVKPDLIITNTSTIPGFAIASFFTQSKHCWFIHELVDEDFESNFIFGKSLSKRIVSYTSKLVLVISELVKSRYIGIVKESKIWKINQPVQIDEVFANKTSKDDSALNLMIIGNIMPHKGQVEAVLACKELLKWKINFKLMIVGLTPYSKLDGLIEIIDDDLKQMIEFIPFTESPQFFYQKTDITLVCSRCEALGRVTIESMKMGTPVIASNTGANIELIKDGVTGFLYEYGNPRDLAEKIIKVSKLTNLSEIAESGRAWSMTHFNFNLFRSELNESIRSAFGSDKCF